MFDQYQLIDDMIVKLNDLADATGVKRCALTVELVQQLVALKKGLKAEEEDRRRASAEGTEGGE